MSEGHGRVYEVDGGRIKVERAAHSNYWSWIDERGRRTSDYRAGYMSHQDCIRDAERETAAVAHEKKAETIYNSTEPEALPWWVGN